MTDADSHLFPVDPPSCTHFNLSILEIESWVGDGEGPAPVIYECDKCQSHFLRAPGDVIVSTTLTRRIDSSSSPEYFKTSVQQAVEQLVAIAKDPDEDAADRLAAIELIFQRTTGEG